MEKQMLLILFPLYGALQLLFAIKLDNENLAFFAFGLMFLFLFVIPFLLPKEDKSE